MKRQTAVLILLVLSLSLALPAFACGPAMTGTSNGNGGQQTNPGREQWTKKRIKHLKQQMSDYNKAQRTADTLGYATGEYVPQMHRNPAEHRQHLINRYEFLALKAERGRATRAAAVFAGALSGLRS